MDAALVGLYLLDRALGRPYWIVTRLLDLNGEANIPAWYSSGQLLVLGLLLGLFAATTASHNDKRSRGVFALPALCLFLSLDEVAQIHEWVGTKSDFLFVHGTRMGSLFPATGLWMFVLGLPFIVVVAHMWRAFAPAVSGRQQVVRLYVVGFLVYVGSALGIETLANFISVGGVASLVQVVAEELGEMVGVTLLVWATLELLASHHIHIEKGTARAQ